MATELRIWTLEEWRAEAKRRGGGNVMACRFRCPLCGNVASIQDFKDAGAESPDSAAQMCIGNLVGAKGNLNSGRPVPQPCDWKAYGLFSTLNEGETILVDGQSVNVFSFADD